jgi:hypothetical protein
MNPTRARPNPKNNNRKPKTRVLSTSEARAHFAEALETAHSGNTIIGFDRYGRTVAALVPVEAVYILAGLGRQVPPATRKEIAAGALLFARNVPYEAPKSNSKSKSKARAKSPAKKAVRRKKRNPQ